MSVGHCVMIGTENDQVGKVVRSSVASQLDVMYSDDNVKSADHATFPESRECQRSCGDVIATAFVVRVPVPGNGRGIGGVSWLSKASNAETCAGAILGLLCAIWLYIERLAASRTHDGNTSVLTEFRVHFERFGLRLVGAVARAKDVVAHFGRFAAHRFPAVFADVGGFFLAELLWMGNTVGKIAGSITETSRISIVDRLPALGAVHTASYGIASDWGKYNTI